MKFLVFLTLLSISSVVRGSDDLLATESENKGPFMHHFNSTCIFLSGKISGLAIYNSALIDLALPLAFYKKLLRQKITLEDLRDLSPTEANSLEQILSYEEDDFEDVFSLTFEVTSSYLDESYSDPLKPGGESLAVTKDNRQEFVDLYVDHKLNSSVLPQITSSPHDIEALRAFLILPCFSGFMDFSSFQALQEPFAQKLLALNSVPLKVVDGWWRSLPVRHFNRLVRIYREIIRYILSTRFPANIDRVAKELWMDTCLRVLSRLSQINMELNRIPHELFYIYDISELIDLPNDYIRFIATRNPNDFSFCKYTDNKTKTVTVALPNATSIIEGDGKAGSSCNVNTSESFNAQTLALKFWDDWVLTFWFSNSTKLGASGTTTFNLFQVDLKGNFNDTDVQNFFPDSSEGEFEKTNPGTEKDHLKGVMVAGADHYERCNTEETLKITDGLSLVVSDLKVQAYVKDATEWGKEQMCDADETPPSEVVPIIVGSCLAALVVVVLVAYLIGRARSGGGYESV